MQQDMEAQIRIWNEVVVEGIAFPQEECLETETGTIFFYSQSYTGVAEVEGKTFMQTADLSFFEKWVSKIPKNCN